MELPRQILGALQQDASLSATVHQALEACAPIISGRPVFFPEYTDHGPTHNTEVLETALSILTDDAQERLTPEDYAALTLSVLLHDCGMHLTGHTFVHLISEDNQHMTKLDDTPWHQLWSDFLMRAKRYDGRQLKAMFGSTDPVSEPPANPDNYTKRDCLLIGEFLRIYHPRLAHEIAVFGFPGVDGSRIRVVRDEPKDLAEISGMIARSHGSSLRESCDTFGKQFHKREYRKVHPPILMAALRIADYLQIQPDRAPESTLKIQKLSSPFSQGEWKVHQSVRNITRADDDPEAIFVDAQPESVEIFLKFKRWAESFQSELDATWAVLGEIYGRYETEKFSDFELRIRRLRTSVDDEKSFAKRVEFLPKKITFEASGPELLGLLVAPLYGNRPEVGLRELIQNSVDAVIERDHIEGKQAQKGSLQSGADVVVYPVFEGKDLKQVVVEDRGIGMDADVIQNYFLRAGASFRSSSQWKKAFTTNEGVSEVARTGRFGIGALAGFLLGSSLTIETRRLGGDAGLKFEAELEQDAIEIFKCSREIGTKITIQIDEAKRKEVALLFQKLASHQQRWDWYCNSYPKLLRLDKDGNELEPRFTAKEGDHWVSVPTSGYSEVLWSHYEIVSQVYNSRVSGCVYGNGIFICEGGRHSRPNLLKSNSLGSDIGVLSPTVLVSDKEGLLPVNLQRDSFTETDTDLSDAIRESMARELIAQAIALAPEEAPYTGASTPQVFDRKISAHFHKGWRYSTNPRAHWCWEDNGWRLADVGIATQKQRLLLLHTEFDLQFLERHKSLLADISIIWQGTGASAGNLNELKEFLRSFIRKDFCNRGQRVGPDSFHLPFQTVVSKDVIEKLSHGNVPNYILPLLSAKSKVGQNYYSIGTKSEDHPLFAKLLEGICHSTKVPFAFSFVGGENHTKVGDNEILIPLWNDLVGSKAIPVAFKDRQAALPKAFEELGDQIQRYRDRLKA